MNIGNHYRMSQLICLKMAEGGMPLNKTRIPQVFYAFPGLRQAGDWRLLSPIIHRASFY